MKIFRKILLVTIAICSVCLFASCSPNEEQPHVHEYGEWQTISESTCNQSGLMKRSCSCGEEEEKSIPFTNEHDYQLTLEVPSDCENDGKNGYTCLVCGNYYEEIVSKTGHTYSETYSYDDEGHYKIATCEHDDLKKDYEEHSFGDWVEEEKATCEKAGKNIRSCICGYFEEQIVEAGHTYSETISYDEEGHYYTATCSHTELKKDYEEHSFGEWETETELDCLINKEDRRYCSCGYYESEITLCQGHTFEEKFTFDEEGHWLKSTCKHTEEIKDYEEHVFSEWKITEPTCLKDGEKQRQCACGYKEKEVIKSNGHTFAEVYSYDCNYHYYKSTCEHNLVKGEEKHQDQNGTCSICQRVVPSEASKDLATSYYSIVGIGYCQDKEIVIPEKLNNSNSYYNEISNYAFEDAELVGVKLTDHITSIGEFAFYDANLEYLYIGSGVTTIGNDAFYRAKIRRVYVEDINTWLNIDFGNMYSNPLCYGAELYVGGELLTVLNVENQYINRIKDYAFYGYQYLEKVILPSNVIYIFDYAFANTKNLKSINLDNVKEICEWAFYCSGLEEVTLTSVTTFIGEEAFYDSNNLKKVTLGYSPNAVINYNVFGLSVNLTDLVICEGVTKLGQSMFISCIALGEVTFPSSLTVIPYYAFQNCHSLSRVVIPSSLEQIQSSAFAECVKLYEVINLSTHITVTKGDYSNGGVGYYAKRVLTSLTDTRETDENGFVFDIIDGETYLVNYVGEQTEITLPDGDYKLYPYAFASAKNLTSVTLGSNVTEIPDGTFRGLDKLKDITVLGNLVSIGDYAFIDTAIEEITFPETLESIGDFAFAGTPLKEIIIPDSVLTLGSHAFQLCTEAKKIIIGDGVRELFASFRDCSSCTELVIGKNVEIIGWYSFAFVSVEELILPDSVVELGDSAFAGCLNLKKLYIGTGLTKTFCSFNRSTDGIPSPDEIHIKDLAKYLSIEFDNTDGSPVRSNTKIYLNGELLQGELIVPESVKVIGEQVLQNYKYITSVILHDEVEKIGDSSFANCLNLEKLVLGSGVKTIGSLAFYNCYKLVEIWNLSNLNITRNTTSTQYGYLPRYVYQVHKSTEISSSKVKINGYLFLKPLENTSVSPVLLGYVGESKDLVLPLDFEGKTYVINAYSFYEREDIDSLTINGKVSSIGESAFQNSSLKSIVLNPTISMAVGKNAFRDCVKAETLVIGEYVTSIDERGFSGLSSVTTDIYLSMRLTTLKNYAFAGFNANINIGHSSRPSNWTNTSLGGVNGTIKWGQTQV